MTVDFSNISGNHTVDATFAIDNYTISSSAGPNGSITPLGDISVDGGSNQSFSISANPSFHIEDVLVDVSSVEAVSNYTFPSVGANHTISATFAANSFTITASSGANGTVTLEE